MTDVSSSEDSSDEEDIFTIVLTNEEPSLPPPLMCLMAKGNSKVCESKDDSDDELDSYEFTNLINEYTSVIKREKGKVKILESMFVGLKIRGILTMFVGCTRHSMGSNKLQGLGMRGFVTS